jgi:hypothetical protein
LGPSITAAAIDLKATLVVNFGTVSEAQAASLTPSVDPIEVIRSQIMAEVATLAQLQARIDSTTVATQAAVGSADASFGQFISTNLPVFQVGNVL